MLTIYGGHLEIRHDAGVIHFLSDQEKVVLTLKGLPIPIPELPECHTCGNLATQVSITDTLYCEDCKEGHEIDHPVKPYEITVLEYKA